MTKRLCEGTGKQGVHGDNSIIYPHCPDCGREFSAEGRKHRFRNPWLAIPKHYR